MSSPRPAALLMGALVLLLVIELLRRRQLREKYAALWLGIGCVSVLIAVFPSLLEGVTRLLGFAVPANLLFFGGGLVLVAISMQLSLEIGRLEDKVRRLAEESALLRLGLERLTERLSSPSPDGQTPDQDRPAPTSNQS